MATALCALIGAALLVGCAPQTSSTPTPTPHFTSEQQAYAAAEQTYRNYIDALNKVDLSDPATFEDVYKWGTGQRRDEDKKALTEYHASGATMTGITRITLLRPQRAVQGYASVDLAACVDVSTLQIHDQEGKSLVAADRPDVQSVSVELVGSPDVSTAYLVAGIRGRSGEPAC